VDDVEGADSAAGSGGSAFMMLTGGTELEDGNSRLGSTDATGGTTPREGRAGDASGGLSAAAGAAAIAVGAATSAGMGRVRTSGGDVPADGSARFGAKPEPTSAIVAVEIAVGAVGSGAAVTETCGAAGAD
jgi:hypothetical protein